MTELYTPPPAYALIEHLRPERTLADQTRTLLTWLAKHDLDAYSLFTSDNTTVVTLRADEGPDAATAIVAARDALPGGRITIGARADRHEGLVVRADGDVLNHGAVRVLAYVDHLIAARILDDADVTVDPDGAEQPVDAASVRYAAGLTHLAHLPQLAHPAPIGPMPEADAPLAAVDVPAPRPAADDAPNAGDDK